MTEEIKPLPEGGTAEVSLLPADTIERIRAKETAQVAAREERHQKRSEAEKLADAVRREELRQIPKASRSADQQREFARLEARRYRANASKEDTISDIATTDQFWAANRLLVSAQKLNTWKEQEQIVLDQIHWMNFGWECSPHDPCFVSLSDGVDLLDDHIAAHGVISDDPHSYKHPLLQEFVPAWGVWADKDYQDPIWGWVKGFWKNPETFRALCSESEPTAICAKFGIQTALPAYAVRMFRARIASHQQSIHGVEREAHVQYDGEKCWLCRFERIRPENDGGEKL